MDIQLSVTMSAYNEEQRISPFLLAVRDYLDAQYPDDYEVIVTDDGSRDRTAQVLAAFQADWPQLIVKTHEVNQGKGAGVRTAMLAARGQRLLFTDADGATPITAEEKLAAALAAGADIAIGSRLVAEDGVTRKRTATRGLAGRVFAACAKRWLGTTVKDSQCGFKMFRREVGHALFALVRETGYLFDLEVLTLANHFDYRIAEVPVNWTEIPGGHLRLVRDSAKMFFGLMRLRRRLLRYGRKEARLLTSDSLENAEAFAERDCWSSRFSVSPQHAEA